MDFTPIPFEDDAPDTAMAAGFEPDAASVARTAVTASGAESALATLQRTIQQYILTKEQDEAALRETRQETDRIRARIVELQRSKQRGALGGRNAVAENDRMIAKHSELMERRLSKAKEGRMLAIANVTRLRAAVDRLRRERVTVLAQCSSIREDMTKVAAEGLAVQNAIAALIAQCDEVEAQTDGTYEENKIQISELEAQHKALVEEEALEDSRTAVLESLAAQLAAGEARAEDVTARVASAAHAADAGSLLASSRIGLSSASSGGANARRGSSQGPRPAAASTIASSAAHSRSVALLPPASGVTGTHSGPSGERPLSRQIQSMLASGRQPSLAELRISARHSVASGNADAAAPAQALAYHGGADATRARVPALGLSASHSLPALGKPAAVGGAAGRTSFATGGGFPAWLSTRSTAGGMGGGAGSSAAATNSRHALETHRRAQQLVLRDAFERAMQLAEVDTVEELVSKMRRMREENEELYQRVSSVAREADDLRSKLVSEWAQTAADREKMAAEDAERTALLASIETKRRNALTRVARMRADNAKLSALVDECRRGFGKLVDVLQGDVTGMDEAGSLDPDADRALDAALAAPGQRHHVSGGHNSRLTYAPDGADARAGGAGGGVMTSRAAGLTSADAATTTAADGTAVDESELHLATKEKDQQDLPTLYMRVETLLATVLSMYSHHLHGVSLPLALPATVLAQALSNNQSMSMATANVAMSRMLSLSPVPGANRSGRPTASSDAGFEAGSAMSSPKHITSQLSVVQDRSPSGTFEVPAARQGLITVTRTERRTSLEYSLMDLRKGLLVEASRANVEAERAESNVAGVGRRNSTSAASGAAPPAASNNRRRSSVAAYEPSFQVQLETGLTPAHPPQTTARTASPPHTSEKEAVPTAGVAVGGSGSSPAAHLAAHAVSPRTHTPGGTPGGSKTVTPSLPYGGRYSVPRLVAEVVLDDTAPESGGSAALSGIDPAWANAFANTPPTRSSADDATPSLSGVRLRVGPESPTRAREGTVRQANWSGSGPRPRLASTSSVSGGYTVVPPPMDADVAARILHRAGSFTSSSQHALISSAESPDLGGAPPSRGGLEDEEYYLDGVARTDDAGVRSQEHAVRLHLEKHLTDAPPMPGVLEMLNTPKEMVPDVDPAGAPPPTLMPVLAPARASMTSLGRSPTAGNVARRALSKYA